MNDNPYFVFAVQMVAIPFFILWGMTGLWVAKTGKNMPRNISDEQLKFLQSHPHYPIARAMQLALVACAYLAAYATPFMIIGWVIVAYGNSFWGWD